MDQKRTQTNRPKSKKVDNSEQGLTSEKWHYIDRRYVSRKEGGRGLVNIEDCVDASIQELKDYVKKIKEKLIPAANDSIGNIRLDRETIKIREKK